MHGNLCFACSRTVIQDVWRSSPGNTTGGRQYRYTLHYDQLFKVHVWRHLRVPTSPAVPCFSCLQSIILVSLSTAGYFSNSPVVFIPFVPFLRLGPGEWTELCKKINSNWFLQGLTWKDTIQSSAREHRHERQKTLGLTCMQQTLLKVTSVMKFTGADYQKEPEYGCVYSFVKMSANYRLASCFLKVI